MRKSWVLAAVIAMMTVGLSAERPREPVQPGSYVVASAEDSRAAVVQARVPVASPVSASRTVSGTLPLLFVGSLLLGLGAAVRRTTT